MEPAAERRRIALPRPLSNLSFTNSSHVSWFGVRSSTCADASRLVAESLLRASWKASCALLATPSRAGEVPLVLSAARRGNVPRDAVCRRPAGRMPSKRPERQLKGPSAVREAQRWPSDAAARGAAAARNAAADASSAAGGEARRAVGSQARRRAASAIGASASNGSLLETCRWRLMPDASTIHLEPPGPHERGWEQTQRHVRARARVHTWVCCGEC
mmetsp:Transcript_101605/g.291673  ORF Transcript_101605/g.291673 Transcript_101605/m.291673 type:complete len:217 (+) Transcript_101605:1191-1841(+)